MGAFTTPFPLPEWVHGGEGGVDADVELVAVHQERVVNKLLHKGAVLGQVQVLDTLHTIKGQCKEPSWARSRSWIPCTQYKGTV